MNRTRYLGLGAGLCVFSTLLAREFPYSSVRFFSFLLYGSFVLGLILVILFSLSQKILNKLYLQKNYTVVWPFNLLVFCRFFIPVIFLLFCFTLPYPSRFLHSYSQVYESKLETELRQAFVLPASVETVHRGFVIRAGGSVQFVYSRHLKKMNNPGISVWGSGIRNLLISRFQVLDGSKKSFFNPGSFLTALLLGNREYLDPRVSLLFREAGILHILALSGFHLGLLLYLFKPFQWLYNHTMKKMAYEGRMPSRWIYLPLEFGGSSLVLILLFGFCFVAVPGPGLFRAGLMAGIVKVSGIFKVRISTWDPLWLSMLILLYLDPDYVHHWGFMLSYLALIGLILGLSPVCFTFRNILGWTIATYLSSGIAAVWGTLPFFLVLNPRMGLVLNGILLGPLLGWVVTIWAILGGLWLLFPFPVLQQTFDVLSRWTEILLLSGRVIPPYQGVFAGFLGWLLWFLVGLLIVQPQYWYFPRHYDRLRFPPIPPVFPGGPGIFNEKKVWTKFHDKSRCKTIHSPASAC